MKFFSGLLLFLSLLSFEGFSQRSAKEYFVIGNDFFRRGDIEMAIRAYNRAIDQDTTVADYYFSRGTAKTYFRNLDPLSDYNKAISIDSLVPEYYHSRGHYWFDKKNFEEALDNYYMAVVLEPSNSNFFFSCAQAREKVGDNEGALTDYDSAILLDPKKKEYFLSRGILLFNLNMGEEALKNFNSALELDAFCMQSQYYRAQHYHLQAKDYEAAIKVYTYLIKSNPGEYLYYSKRGDVKYDKGDFRGAVKDYSIAVAWDKGDGYSFFCRGLARYNLNDRSRACRDWRRAKDLNFIPASEQIEKHCIN
jgi:tetratricopeptide (TPR) repeat protein